jgi:hypothetical protein
MFGVRAMDELSNKTVVQQVGVVYISNRGAWKMQYIKLLTTVCNGGAMCSQYGNGTGKAVPLQA